MDMATIDNCKMFTSYFRNAVNIVAECPDACLVSIAGNTPQDIDCLKYKPLMPQYSWWKEWHDKYADCIDSDESIAWYSHQYKCTVLDKLDPQGVYRDLMDMSDGHPVVMLCYEMPERFCHRHIVAKWLDSSKLKCKEWK